MIIMTCVFLAALLGEGTCGVYSPDGDSVALQRTESGKSRVGVLNRKSGAFAWIEPGRGNAAYPAWSPSGDAIVYAYGNETNTAWAAKGGDTGYHLRIWRGGSIREITTGRFRDYMPSFSRDGGKVFFSSTRCASPEVFLATRSGIYAVDVDDLAGTRPCRVRNNADGSWSRPYQLAPSYVNDEGARQSVVADGSWSRPYQLVPSHVNDEGAGQPVVSPDGKMLALAQISGFRSTWRIVCAWLSEPE